LPLNHDVERAKRLERHALALSSMVFLAAHTQWAVRQAPGIFDYKPFSIDYHRTMISR
jgi:hypothetical protein